MAFDYTTVDLHDIMARAYGEMSEKQRAGVGKARGSKRCIFDVWMGVGKTFMGLTAGLMTAPQTFLVICSKSAMSTWETELEKWFPEFATVGSFVFVKGQQHERQFEYSKVKKANGPLFYVTTGGSFIRDIKWLIDNKIHFDVIEVDEPQKIGLRNEKSQGWKALKAISNHNYWPLKMMVFMTGSLTSKGNPQLWPYLHLMNPQLFRSKWKFLETFNYITNGPFGRHIGLPRNTEGLATITSPYIYRVSEEDAATELPPLRRIKLHVEMTPNLWSLYNSMESEAFMELDNEEKELIVAPNPMSKFIKLRQFINCPATFDPKLGVGPAIEGICDKIMENDEIKYFKHNVVFTPFLPAIPFFHDYMSEALKMPKSDILVMQGGMEPEEVKKVEDTFRANRETAVLCSLKFAQSFNLETGLNPYFSHFEWIQDDNEQAEARLRRKTSDKERTIMSYYCSIRRTVSDDVFDVLNAKHRGNKMTYQDFAAIRDRARARHQAKQKV